MIRYSSGNFTVLPLFIINVNDLNCRLFDRNHRLITQTIKRNLKLILVSRNSLLVDRPLVAASSLCSATSKVHSVKKNARSTAELTGTLKLLSKSGVCSEYIEVRTGRVVWFRHQVLMVMVELIQLSSPMMLLYRKLLGRDESGRCRSACRRRRLHLQCNDCRMVFEVFELELNLKEHVTHHQHHHQAFVVCLLHYERRCIP